MHAAQREQGLTFSREAPKHTLIRRLYFNLIGLPPSVEQTAAFVEGRVRRETLHKNHIATGMVQYV